MITTWVGGKDSRPAIYRATPARSWRSNQWRAVARLRFFLEIINAAWKRPSILAWYHKVKYGEKTRRAVEKKVGCWRSWKRYGAGNITSDRTHRSLWVLGEFRHLYEPPSSVSDPWDDDALRLVGQNGFACASRSRASSYACVFLDSRFV